MHNFNENKKESCAITIVKKKTIEEIKAQIEEGKKEHKYIIDWALQSLETLERASSREMINVSD